MSFDVEIGWVCERGNAERNEDFAAALRDARRSGLVAAVADGVSTGGLGLMAAQTTVRSVVDEFFSAPDTWETTVALDRIIGAQNSWLADHNRRAGSRGGSGATTLTALALQGHGWTLAHVGDTRAWLLRGGALEQLTTDHARQHLDFSAQLTRAVGLDEHVRVDYQQGELQVGDTFLLTSDGVHDWVQRSEIATLLGTEGAQAASEAVVRAALAAGSRDNATALVIRVKGLAPERLEDAIRQGRQLPSPGKLKLGDVLDGFRITALVADNGVHRLYQARHAASGELVAIKTLHEARGSDPEERSMLAHEAWLGLRVAAHRAGELVRVRENPDASAFYVVFDWHEGRTLEQLLAEGTTFSIAEIVAAAAGAARALGRLHRQGVIHRDIKPGNLHRGADGRWRILDLSVALSGRESAALRTLHAGTPSYMNPEQWGIDGGEKEPADAGSDLFALGVTLYRWLTGGLPYGEIEPYQRAPYRRDPVAPSRRRPDVPIWLDHVVLKAVARDRNERFETGEELALALERGASRPLTAPLPTPLVTRDPAALWKLAFLVSLLFNALLVVWLLWLPS
jgi:serine/threonine protein phosphatase PrpC